MQNSLTCSLCNNVFDLYQFSKNQRKKGWERKCRKCVDGYKKWRMKYIEILNIFNILTQSSLINTYIKNDNIIINISEYGFGSIIKCCNEKDECNNEICIDDEYDLATSLLESAINRLSYSGNFFGYFVKDKYLNMVNNTVKLYGGHYRIFCKQCYHQQKLFKCEFSRNISNYTKCNNLDSNIKLIDKIIRQYSHQETVMMKVCPIHPHCFNCNVYGFDKELKCCGGCKQYFCTLCEDEMYFEHKLLCKNCISLQEYKRVKDNVNIYSLKYTQNRFIIDINIINIITNYAMGYIVQCCNKKNCKKMIFIENKQEFMEHTKKCDEWMKYYREYYYYTIDKENKKNDTLWIYDEQIRIFCQDCCLYHCERCEYEMPILRSRYCDNWEVCNYQSNNNQFPLCMAHRHKKIYKELYPYYCKSCNQKKSRFVRFYTCKRCESYICIDCRYHSEHDDNGNCFKSIEDYDDDVYYRKTIKRYSLI